MFRVGVTKKSALRWAWICDQLDRDGILHKQRWPFFAATSISPRFMQHLLPRRAAVLAQFTDGRVIAPKTISTLFKGPQNNFNRLVFAVASAREHREVGWPSG